MQLQLQISDRGSVPVLHDLRIGRDPRNDVVLDNASVSRWHAVVFLTRGGLAVRDERSTNGTFVNDQRVRGLLAVQPGDSIRVGSYTLRVEARATRHQSPRTSAPAAAAAQAHATRLPRRHWMLRRVTAVYLVFALAALSLVVLLGITSMPSKSSQFVLPTPVAIQNPDTPKAIATGTTAAGMSMEWADVFAQTAPSVAVVENEAAASSGTAFFIDDHHALTNAHVVNGASSVRLTAFSGQGARPATPIDARVLAEDTAMDLAMLSVAEAATGHLALTKLDAVRVGDDVMAIGEPHGLGWTATFGRIGALRQAGELDLSQGLTALQFDAAINPGNSGGPLIARNGTVIGVVTFGIRNASGLSFAIAGEPLWTRARDWIAKDRESS